MTNAKKDEPKTPSDNLFPVVGIGASAGGLDAFTRFLKAIPENSGMAYILVQHLDPSHESILADLLQKVTKIPVLEITDNIRVVPDHIYIIPSNKLLTATDGILQLSPRPPKTHVTMVIDLFFTSLAEVHQSHAIGVVLSGTATDGTLGLKAIKDQGGITFAQEQESAAYVGMLQSAIDAEIVDFILPPEKMPAQLLALNDLFKLIPVNSLGNIDQMQENSFKQILFLLHTRKGVDFTHYKQTDIRRRIIRRIALSKKRNITEYKDYLKENSPEQDILYQDLLLAVTEFFRDQEIFEYLNGKIFPTLLQDRPVGEHLRIWIAGCSTGEEAYSIVMCLFEFLGDNASAVKIQVFATDISEIAIAKARSGIYNNKEVSSLSVARLQQFFTKAGSNFQVNKSVRDICIFACHNYLKDPPFAKIDLISCRNSLMNMETLLQKKALDTFHYALKEKGFLLLGKSETTAQASELYNVFDKNSKIYSKKEIQQRFVHAEGRAKFFKGTHYEASENVSSKADFKKKADDILLASYVPPGVIVNSEMNIVQFRGATGIWLEPSPGKPSLNVLKMAREGLAFELRNVLHKVKNSKVPLVKADIPMQFMGGERLVTIEAIPLLNITELHFLILFRDKPLASDTHLEQINDKRQKIIPDARQNKLLAENQRLKKELAQAREDMKSITEEQEAVNEELQSVNEELLSGSEELQSLNEELETSKEEIQTSNEELIILNNELYERNEQLNLSRQYSESIVNTIREPLIILNKNLQIRSANQSFYSKFQTIEEEIVDKYLFELGDEQWDIPDLRKMLEKILPEKGNIVGFEFTLSFPGVGERALLLNASRIFMENSKEQFVLLAIEDITEKKKNDNELRSFAEKLEKQVLERTFSLQQANIALQHSNEHLEQFAHIASHDLQEPLRKIRIYSTLLQSKHSISWPNETKELVAKITSSSERMSTLIKELLNFSKVLHSEAAFEKTDLNVILNSVINDFELLITEKNAVIQHDRLPFIEAIPLQINQLFYNLISNSLKYSKKGIAPVISITSKILTPTELEKHTSLNQELSYYEFSFKDNGIGFEQQYANQIFLIFKRLHSREQFSGTGIGLALCKNIVVNHKGEIFGSSTMNDGALFRVLIPLRQIKM